MRKSLQGKKKERYGKSTDAGVRQVIEYMDNHPEHSLPLGMNPPYEWINKYRVENVELKWDETRDLTCKRSHGFTQGILNCLTIRRIELYGETRLSKRVNAQLARMFMSNEKSLP